MKALPVKLVSGQYVPAPISEATHLTLHFPGPAGQITLPVITKGRREGTGNWTWNGDTEKPTLRPSVLTEGNEYLGGDPVDLSQWRPYRCHTWVTGGKAQFLDDTTHDLRGQTVEMLDAA